MSYSDKSNTAAHIVQHAPFEPTVVQALLNANGSQLYMLRLCLFNITNSTLLNLKCSRYLNKVDYNTVIG